MEELKPCPFCGSSEVRCISFFRDDEYYIQCNNCGAESGLKFQERKAIEAWNKRV